jgi:hypothetical protein
MGCHKGEDINKWRNGENSNGDKLNGAQESGVALKDICLIFTGANLFWALLELTRELV